MQDNNDPFFDIRPYHDNEVADALARLAIDPEFINAIIKFRFPNLAGKANSLLTPFVRSYLRYKWRNIKTIHDVQMHVAKYMISMLKTSSEGFSCSGIEKLSPDQSYLFISNHRDIAMDPAFVNWSLHINGFDTVRIAIGDNLLQKPSATELMKLNKSFIVKRSVKAPREMMKALTQLSAYIKSSLDEKQSIWIAQKEGRAKDGNDCTDPAILKMFYMQGRQEKINFNQYIASLKIVPVSISYENDPCDSIKAAELHQTKISGSYEKKEFEDIDSIVKGIIGQKRRIHVAFGDVIGDEFETPEALAAEIDRQIHHNYFLYPINYIAANLEHDSVTDTEKAHFARKLTNIPLAQAEIIQTIYATPAHKKLVDKMTKEASV